MAASPYGFWPSSLTSDFVVADPIRLRAIYSTEADIIPDLAARTLWSWRTRPLFLGRATCSLILPRMGEETRRGASCLNSRAKGARRSGRNHASNNETTSVSSTIV